MYLILCIMKSFFSNVSFKIAGDVSNIYYIAIETGVDFIMVKASSHLFMESAL